MKALSCRLIQFRNVEDRSFVPGEGLTVFTGPNGSGKTNVLEAFFLASIGRSLRTNQDQEMIGLSHEEGTVILSYVSGGVENTIKVRLFRKGGKKLFFNDNPVRRKDLLGLFRTVLFTPDEMKLVKGMPRERRRFIDMELSQVNPRYVEEVSRVHRAVAQRNAEFRNAHFNGRKPQVDMWDMQIARGSAYVLKKRMEALEKMNAAASEMTRRLTGGRETMTIKYRQAGNEGNPVLSEDWFIRKLAENREEDTRLMRTSIGPHRDDLVFLLNGRELSAYGSQGQQRTAVLALKLSEIQFIREETGENPVLLLDDVMGELDASRRQALISYVEEHDVQTIITSTDSVGDGKIIEMS